jgi:hypothetical protein
MADVTVDVNSDLQTMKGWEAVCGTGLYDYLTTGVNFHDAALDAFVDLGGNRIRTEIKSGLVENSTDYFGNYLADGRDYSTNAAYSAVGTNNWIPVNDDGNSSNINAGGFQWSYVDWEYDNFVEPLSDKLAVRGETLFWNMCYVHFSASNQLHIDTAAEYGELILATWQHLDSTYGRVPDALEIFLEPDNTASVTGAELAAMIIAARDRLVAAGFSKPYIIAPSTVSGPNASVLYAAIKSANATAAGYIDEICYHRYVNVDQASQEIIGALRTSESKNTSMLEWADTAATYIACFDDIRYGEVSAWQQFSISYPFADVGDSGWQYFNSGASPTYTITEGQRTKYLRHIFQFVRYGAIRKDVTNSNSSYPGLAFENTNGKYAVVVKCASSQTINVKDLPAGTYGIRYTTGDGSTTPSAYFQTIANQTIGVGEDVSFSMPGAGVVTVFDVDYLTSPAAPTTVALSGAVTMSGVSLQ